MTLYHLVFNPYQVNTYILAGKSGKCAIVDPACCSPEERAALKKFIEDKNLQPLWLINTHGHFDHVIGNAFVAGTWPVKTVAHREDLFLIQNAYRQGEAFGYPVEQPPVPEVFPEDKSTLVLDGEKLWIYHIPGHSPGSIVLHSPEDKRVIVGDVLFNGSIGRTDLPGGDFDRLIGGIRSKLLTLPPDTLVFPGHGPETSIGQEMMYNPFLNGK
jgi:glyoxylase-like metal-dependent hydrolase (beta-lactamase superfamily II)